MGSTSLKNKFRSWIELDRHNLRHNVEVFRRLIKPAFPIWIVKANAYGHGLHEISSSIAKTIKKGRGEWFGVDSIDEAIELRRLGIHSPVIILGYVPIIRFKELSALHVRLLVSCAETVRALTAARGGRSVPIHLKIDTGTTRQGVLPDQALQLALLIRKNGMVLEGLAMHFANVEDTDNPTYAHLQLERFIQCVRNLRMAGFRPPIIHSACSAAAMIYPESIFSAARVGIGLYGINPSPLVSKVFSKRHAKTQLRPVLSLYSRLALIKTIAKGTPIGYGLTEHAARTMTVGIVPIGFADGFDRRFSSIGEVIIKKTRCRVLGRVCMNMIIVDASAVPQPHLQDEVQIIGPQETAQKLADLIGTIPYEVISRLNPLLPRIVV